MNSSGDRTKVTDTSVEDPTLVGDFMAAKHFLNIVGADDRVTGMARLMAVFTKETISLNKDQRAKLKWMLEQICGDPSRAAARRMTDVATMVVFVNNCPTVDKAPPVSDPQSQG